MRKLHLMSVALIVFAFGVFGTASASALETLLAEWLLNNVVGIPPNTEYLVETHGELLLEDLEATILKIKAKILCSFNIDGWLGYNGSDLITELLDLSGNAISQLALVEPALACENQENCEEPLLWAVNLPWKTLLYLLVIVLNTNEPLVVLIEQDGKGTPGYYLACMKGPTGEVTDECSSADTIFRVTNEGNNVDGLFEERLVEEAGLKLITCTSSGGKETGIIEGLVTILPPELYTSIAVSSE